MERVPVIRGSAAPGGARGLAVHDIERIAAGNGISAPAASRCGIGALRAVPALRAPVGIGR